MNKGKGEATVIAECRKYHQFIVMFTFSTARSSRKKKKLVIKGEKNYF